ncbi:MAG: hypothetical protein OXG97_01825 [Candidatus Poribacteria bacterium]|nr:hypothetical protein [Candidatus Poribacteria bacterium]
MLKNFLNKPNALWQVFIVLLVAGGLAFAGMYDGFVVETEAQKSCCGGGTDAASSAFSFAQSEAKSCCGSQKTNVPSDGTDVPRDFSDDDPCGCITQSKCGSTSCDPNDCTVKKCPPGDCVSDCPCEAQCNSYDCSGGCESSDTRSPE